MRWAHASRDSPRRPSGPWPLELRGWIERYRAIYSDIERGIAGAVFLNPTTTTTIDISTTTTTIDNVPLAGRLRKHKEADPPRPAPLFCAPPAAGRAARGGRWRARRASAPCYARLLRLIPSLTSSSSCGGAWRRLRRPEAVFSGPGTADNRSGMKNCVGQIREGPSVTFSPAAVPPAPPVRSSSSFSSSGCHSHPFPHPLNVAICCYMLLHAPRSDAAAGGLATGGGRWGAL